MTTEEMKKKGLALIDWLEKETENNEEDVPLLAMTLGMMIGMTARGTPVANIERGCDIVHMLIKTAALYEAGHVELAIEVKDDPAH